MWCLLLSRGVLSVTVRFLILANVRKQIKTTVSAVSAVSAVGLRQRLIVAVGVVLLLNHNETKIGRRSAIGKVLQQRRKKQMSGGGRTRNKAGAIRRSRQQKKLASCFFVCLLLAKVRGYIAQFVGC